MGQSLTPYWQLSSQGPLGANERTDSRGMFSFLDWNENRYDRRYHGAILIFINLLLWSGSTELRTNAFAVRSFAPNSVNSEQCEQAKSCEQRIVRTVHTEPIIRTANRANSSHTNSSYCWNSANSTNSSFFRNRRTGWTDANTVRWSLLMMKGYQSAICSSRSWEQSF